ncbi:MAG: nucleoside triphosphate pyrophosphohydrolase, partial [Clostridia bacterium]|nr:nucleoside triphosphate pyrophosphohydrolase [Clostridia bacterium]
EAYEAVGAIHDGDLWHLADERGDVLLQVVLHAGIAQRHGEFSIRDVTTAIAQKMIHRHSHIFGHDSADTADSVGALWSRNKMLERGQTTQSEVLKDMPTGFPALLRAAKVLKRVDAAFGREGLDVSEAARQAEEALRASANATDMEFALGQALFAMIALCRARGVDAELALTRAVDQCIARFEQCEAKVRRSGRQWSALTKEELGELYRDFSTEHER